MLLQQQYLGIKNVNDFILFKISSVSKLEEKMLLKHNIHIICREKYRYFHNVDEHILVH